MSAFSCCFVCCFSCSIWCFKCLIFSNFFITCNIYVLCFCVIIIYLLHITVTFTNVLLACTFVSVPIYCIVLYCIHPLPFVFLSEDTVYWNCLMCEYYSWDDRLWLGYGVLMAAILCPAVPTGNFITPSTDNQLFGTVVDYQCLPGHYVHPNTPVQYDSLSIECLESKVWNFTAIPDCAREWLQRVQKVVLVSFPVLLSTYSRRVTTYVGKPSAISQPFIHSGSINE